MSAEYLGCGVAIEASYASVSATTQEPDPSGLSFVHLPWEREQVTETWGATPQNDNARLRSHTHQYPPTPNTQYLISASRRRDRREGEITLSIFVDTIGGGAAFATYALHPLRAILGTSMGALADPGTLTDTVSGGIEAGAFEPTLAHDAYPPGQLFSSEAGGKFRVAQVTGTAVDRVNYSPEVVSGGLSSGALRFMHTMFALGPGGTPAVGSVALRLVGDGVMTYAYGCKLARITGAETNNQLRFDLTLVSPFIVDDHANAPALIPEPIIASGIMAHRLAAPVAISAPVTGTAPLRLTSQDLELAEAGFEVIFNHDNQPYQSTHVPYQPKLVSTDVTVTGRLKPPTTALDNDYNSETRRQLLLAYGPHGQGAGVAIFLPGAFLTGSPKRRQLASGELVAQELEWRAGAQQAVTGTTAVAKSPFLIGFGL